MSSVGRVISDPGGSLSAPPNSSALPARAVQDFRANLTDDPLLARRDSQQLETLDAPNLNTETSRRRALEELRTLVRAIQSGITDQFQLTDLVFYARHPELIGVPLTSDQQSLLDEWNAISALLVHPTLNELGNVFGVEVSGGIQGAVYNFETVFDPAHRFPASQFSGRDATRFDEVIRRAVDWCPGLSPAILKGLLAQESNFNPAVINKYGYAGIAQFGRNDAREVGLQVGIVGSETDERLNPFKAIPAAARLLNLKAMRLGELAFSRYGEPDGLEFWKFVLAAYNGGEGTITLAMGRAYRDGLSRARANGLVGYEAVSFARSYASRWENLRAGGEASPLALAAARYFPALALSKYYEIANYPTAIVARSMNRRG